MLALISGKIKYYYRHSFSYYYTLSFIRTIGTVLMFGITRFSFACLITIGKKREEFESWEVSWKKSTQVSKFAHVVVLPAWVAFRLRIPISRANSTIRNKQFAAVWRLKGKKIDANPVLTCSIACTFGTEYVAVHWVKSNTDSVV